MKTYQDLGFFKSIGDRVMLLDGFSEDNNIKYFKNISIDKIKELTDFPNLGINETSIISDKENEALVTPNIVAALAERKLRRKRKSEDKTDVQMQQEAGQKDYKKEIKEGDKKHEMRLQGKYLTLASKNPGTQMNTQAIDALNKKIARLDTLIEKRKKILSKAKNKYNSNKRTVVKLQRIINSLESKKREIESVQQVNRIERKIRSLTKRKINYLRKADNYNKLANLAKEFIKISEEQITILKQLKDTIENGDHIQTIKLINSFYKLSIKAKNYRNIRETQKKVWSKQTKSAKLTRLRSRRAIVEKVIAKYKLISKHKTLSEEEQKEYKIAIAKAEIIDKQIAKLTNGKLKPAIDFRPSFERDEKLKPETALSGININELYLVQDIEW